MLAIGTTPGKMGRDRGSRPATGHGTHSVRQRSSRNRRERRHWGRLPDFRDVLRGASLPPAPPPGTIPTRPGGIDRSPGSSTGSPPPGQRPQCQATATAVRSKRQWQRQRWNRHHRLRDATRSAGILRPDAPRGATRAQQQQRRRRLWRCRLGQPRVGSQDGGSGSRPFVLPERSRAEGQDRGRAAERAAGLEPTRRSSGADGGRVQTRETPIHHPRTRLLETSPSAVLDRWPRPQGHCRGSHDSGGTRASRNLLGDAGGRRR
mmetsp:Transcript_8735/g.25920  ORF Transcript_8735/g.25920 Transcript_8735/m.25920 type:complete len:263 (-) Transcript_8735:499-1287(-)